MLQKLLKVGKRHKLPLLVQLRRPLQTLTIRPQEQYVALQRARERQATADFAKKYVLREGIESTISQAIRVMGLRRSRYIGEAKTHLQHLATAAAINMGRLASWLDGKPRARTLTSAFVRLHQVRT